MKPLNLARLFATVVLFCGVFGSLPRAAEPLHFALLAKRVDDPFFIGVAEGCAEAAQSQGDTCQLLGPLGSTHFRQQDEALERAIEQSFDGIALSVTHSKWLADHALRRLGQTLLITFDSDLEPGERHLRRGYVGLDNLGRLAQRFRPHGGRLCILGASPQNTNLQERLRGIRQQLGGIEPSASGEAERLNG